ncbi:MAG: DNA methyltransferase [Anaerovoracaceae bacterium]|jgi:site-specific DNA-methyltransferase (adenine-specific)
MSLLAELSGIIESGRSEYEAAKAGDFRIFEDDGSADSILAQGDNLAFMKYLAGSTPVSCVQCIYADPPFYTGSRYAGSFKVTPDLPAVKPQAYDDKWSGGMRDYLSMLIPRLFMMKELLAEDGLIWMHLDWHVMHYVKVVMDEIFGADNFINEIVWQYKSGGSSKKHFARKHDTILLYSKGRNYKLHVGREKSYNRGFKPYHFKGVEEFQDDIGWYTMVNRKDIWQIDMVGRTSRERTGYATQKPLALMERIIESSSDEGDICADFFAGSGSLAVAAEKLGRRWICADSGSLAAGVAQKRLADCGARYCFMREEREPAGGARLEASAAGRDGLTSISIDGYTVDVEQLPISEKDREQLAVSDQIQLLERWSVDTAYNGVVHKSTLVFTRKDGRIETTAVTTEPVSAKISIIATDVFGNSVHNVLSLVE